jgi:exodeoxyribonuclease III
MPFTIATWNINSVRLRLPIVQRLLAEEAPDVLCLQETKCPNELFPLEAFHAAGYPHVAIHGQKGYHGVATISRHPFEREERRDFCQMGDARHLALTLRVGERRIRVHNLYVPAGGDEPDPLVNPKFDHKLRFLAEMRRMRAQEEAGVSSILVGDLNVAPLEHDVWSHKQLLKIVSHTPVETEEMLAIIRDGGWRDLLRRHIPEPAKLYTWWSYRAKDWDAADKGRRLDHIWSSPDLEPHLSDVRILRAARGWTQPSDHVPVLATLDV